MFGDLISSIEEFFTSSETFFVSRVVIVIGAFILFVLFIAFLNHVSKAKCPKCKSKKCKEVSSNLIHERRRTRTREENGTTKRYDVWESVYDFTYECQKCKNRFVKREKRSREV